MARFFISCTPFAVVPWRARKTNRILFGIQVSCFGTRDWRNRLTSLAVTSKRTSSRCSGNCSDNVGIEVRRCTVVSSNTDKARSTGVSYLSLTDSSTEFSCVTLGTLARSCQAKGVAKCTGWAGCWIDHSSWTVVALKTSDTVTHSKVRTIHSSWTWGTGSLS